MPKEASHRDAAGDSSRLEGRRSALVKFYPRLPSSVSTTHHPGSSFRLCAQDGDEQFGLVRDDPVDATALHAKHGLPSVYGPDE